MRCLGMCVLCLLCIGSPATASAEGLIYQLPEDGAWVRFKATGEGIAPDGTVTVTVHGTQIMRSVGRTTTNNQECRWIELDTEMTFERKGGEPAMMKEFIKILVPETRLAKGEDPRAHVIKAYTGASPETIRELELKGNDAREIQSLDEIFHAPLKEISKLAATTIDVEKRTWNCEGFTGKTVSEGSVFTTETRTHKDAPFGVVTYRYEKERQRGNQPQGKRTMKWILEGFGKDAISAAPNAK